MEKTNRLYRSTTSKVFGGVAGGIAEYFDIDPIIIRMLFLVIALAGGGGVLVYVILWIAIPVRPLIPPVFNMGQGTPFYVPPPPGESSAEAGTQGQGAYNAEPVNTPPQNIYENKKGALMGGMILITLGCIFLADRFIPHVSIKGLWPLVLVVVGVVLIVSNFSEKKNK